MSDPVKFSVFTKPWKTQPLPELARLVCELGFNGLELPVRPGYQVDPENARRDLLGAVRLLDSFGLKVFSVAGNADEETASACAEAGVPVIRICVFQPVESYLESEAIWQREWDALLPTLERTGVTLGVQNHFGRSVNHASGLHRLLERYDPKQVAAVWDAAHNALQGEEPEPALDIIWPHLCMVNLKNAFWQRTNGPEAETAAWQPYWTLGRHGLASWARVVTELKRRSYQGVVCLTAEYSDTASVERLIAEDLEYAKDLWNG